MHLHRVTYIFIPLAGADLGRGFMIALKRVSIAIAIILCALLISVVIKAMRINRRATKKRGAACGNCDYDLRGLPQLRCPECGYSVDAAGVSCSEFPRPLYPFGRSFLWTGIVLGVGVLIVPLKPVWIGCYYGLVMFGIGSGGLYLIRLSHQDRLRDWRVQSSAFFTNAADEGPGVDSPRPANERGRS
ncbi:MAG: hypothetical protein JWP03_4126 [Phycisphaerales bacterium]|nr:hypothetical protein [Phycisphaerales bacterium]